MILQDIFQGRQFVLDLPVFTSYKEKQLLKEKITKNNGIISYAVTRRTDYVVRASGSDDSYRARIAAKFGVKVITTDFVDVCLEKGKLVDSKLYVLSEARNNEKNLFADGKIVTTMEVKPKSRSKKLSLIKTWLYKDRDGPTFHNDPYTVVKAVVLKGKEKQMGYPFCVIEIHCNLTNESEHDPCLKYCVFTHQGVLPVMSDIKHFGTKTCRFIQTATEALDVFDQLYKLYSYPPHSMTCCKTFPSHKGLGSDCFHVEDWLLASVLVEAKVAQFVANIWTESINVLDSTLSVPLKNVRENQIVQAESLLIDISKALNTDDGDATINKFSKEFYKVLLHRSQHPINSLGTLASEYNLCRLLRDFIFLQESVSLSDRSIVEQQYFSLHCDIQLLENGYSEYQEIASLILDNSDGLNLTICNIFSVHRTCEDVDFTYNIENKKLLFHGTKVENVVGILSRGLLLSEVIVSHPIQRDHTSVSGAGLYFTNQLTTANKHTFPGKTTGRRLLLINEVALGECYDTYTTDKQLTRPPDGFHSFRGVKHRNQDIGSDFGYNEYIICNINQQRLRYVVEFCQANDMPTVDVRPPTVDCTVLCVDPCKNLSASIKTAPEEHTQLTFDIQQFLNKHNSDTTSTVVGLQSECNDPIPLKSMHVRAKLIDLAAEVVIMQEYINDTETTIEARYVFPLGDKAAVCGFEAFSDGHHFIGRIEEKKEAQMEYKQAVESGKRAYLMDEEAPDVFKVSIGNVKPHSTVLVKIRYVAELNLDGDLISFRLPGSVSPWQQELGLKSQLQSATKTAKVSDIQNINTSVELFVEMPFDIKSLYSPTHEVKTKKTASHAVVTTYNNASLNSGFQLLIGLSEIHVPRMWVEKHPKFDSSACMLTFYPEFVSDTKHDAEVILALDASNSMTGSTFSAAQQISILCLHYLPPETKFNVLVFGSVYYEAFPSARQRSIEEIYEAQKFILQSQPTLGSSKISHFLQSYIHLKPEANTLRNIYIITDGYLQELNPVLQNVAKQTCHTRIFCLGVGKFVNHHLLNKISRAGAGSYEYFDEKIKSKWASKAQSQMLKVEEPVLTDVKVEWQQFDNSETEIIQAPQQITSVFSGSRVIVYGFVPNCSLAVLKGNVLGAEFSTMVFTSELGKSTGSTLHCLTTKALVSDWESGFLDQDKVHHEVSKRAFQPNIVALSKKHSIITPLTSFVAVEDKDNKITKRYTGQPSIDEFVQDECVDFLQYLRFHVEFFDEGSKGSDTGGVKRHRTILDESSLSRCTGGIHLQAELRDFTDDLLALDCGNDIMCTGLDADVEPVYPSRQQSRRKSNKKKIRCSDEVLDGVQFIRDLSNPADLNVYSDCRESTRGRRVLDDDEAGRHPDATLEKCLSFTGRKFNICSLSLNSQGAADTMLSSDEDVADHDVGIARCDRSEPRFREFDRDRHVLASKPSENKLSEVWEVKQKRRSILAFHRQSQSFAPAAGIYCDSPSAIVSDGYSEELTSTGMRHNEMSATSSSSIDFGKLAALKKNDRRCFMSAEMEDDWVVSLDDPSQTGVLQAKGLRSAVGTTTVPKKSKKMFSTPIPQLSNAVDYCGFNNHVPPCRPMFARAPCPPMPLCAPCPSMFAYGMAPSLYPISQDTYHKKQTKSKESKVDSISFRAGLPFFSLLMKRLVAKMDFYILTPVKKQIDDILASSVDEFCFPVLKSFDSDGGIQVDNLPEGWNYHLWSEIQLQLVNNGLKSMGSIVHNSILRLIATMSVLFGICQQFCSTHFPLDLTSLSCIENVVSKIEEMFDDNEIDFFTLLYVIRSILFITSVNQRHPLVYRTLELGNSWEEAVYFLTSGQNLIEIKK